MPQDTKVKKVADAISEIGKKTVAPPNNEAESLLQQQNNTDAYRSIYGIPDTPESVGANYAPKKPSPTDLVNKPGSKFGDRPGEKRFDPKELDEMTKPLGRIKVYDEGGDVDVNDGKHQLAVLQDGEKVLTPEQNAAYKAAQTLPVDDRKAPESPSGLGSAMPPAPKATALGNAFPSGDRDDAARDLIRQDKEKAAQSGDLIGLGKGILNERHLLSSPAEPLVPAQKTSPLGSAMPTEMHQNTVGGPLVSGAPTNDSKGTQRDFSNMERKAKLADYDQRIQQALDEATPQGQERADRLRAAKAGYAEATPVGRSPFGNALHGLERGLSTAGNIAGDVFAPAVMELIPGTQLNRAARAGALRNAIDKDAGLRIADDTANAKDVSATKPKLLNGEENVRTSSTGERQRAWEMPDNSVQWVPEGRTPSTGLGQAMPSAPAASPLGTVNVPSGADAWTYGKPGSEKAETREQHLNRYAELRNLEGSGQLKPADQKELQTLRTELSVGQQNSDAANKRIDAALREGKVPQSEWNNYHVSPTATDAEVKDMEASAKAHASELYQEGSEGRQEDKETRAQDRKDKAAQVYAETSDGQVMLASKYDVEHAPAGKYVSSEEVKPGDVTKDRAAVRQLNDVQKNVSRYEDSIGNDLQKVTEADRDSMKELFALQEQSGNSLFSVSERGISLSSIPVYGAKLTKKNFDQAADLLKSLTPEGRNLMNNYLRTAAAVPAYQKALTNIGRSNKEMLDLELANVPLPYYDKDTLETRMKAFQENVDQAKTGFPRNLPGLKLVEPSAGSPTVPPGATHTGISSVDGKEYYLDANGTKLAPVRK